MPRGFLQGLIWASVIRWKCLGLNFGYGWKADLHSGRSVTRSDANARTQEGTIAELQRANVGLRRERDTALTQRDSDCGARTAHQVATIDVLKLMSASPADPQSVFDLIVERARGLCDAYGVAVAQYSARSDQYSDHQACPGQPLPINSRCPTDIQIWCETRSRQQRGCAAYIGQYT
jgi:hypothetical protein